MIAGTVTTLSLLVMRLSLWAGNGTDNMTVGNGTGPIVAQEAEPTRFRLVMANNSIKSLAAGNDVITYR